MQTVVVPLDGSELSERALAPGLVLARRAGAELRLVSCPWEGVPVDVEAYLADHAAGIDLESVRTVVGQEKPATAVLDAVVGAADPVVCMSTHGHTGMGRVLLGSVAEEVLCAAPCPVLLCGPEMRPESLGSTGSHLVLCTDGSDHAEAVLPAAADLARVLELAVSVVEVVAPNELVMTGEEPPPDEGSAVAQGHLDALVGWLRAAGVEPCRAEQLHGADPAAAVVHHAARLPAAAIAMATHGRSGLARVVLGSITMSVVRHSTCPVLVIRPAVLA
jgi:nucleotide-binding universal stress UspA family protein